jgi:hypothetical protein
MGHNRNSAAPVRRHRASILGLIGALLASVVAVTSRWVEYKGGVGLATRPRTGPCQQVTSDFITGWERQEA